MHHSDIEHVLPQSSSSYGSLESGSNLQQSSDGNGLSMHAATAAANAAFGSEDFEKQNEQPNSGHRGHTHDCDHEHHPAHHEHLVKSRQYYRDMVLGVNDGLVSTFLLVAGVVGGGMDVSGVLLTAVSGAIAGAISMFAGEYVATKSQNEVMEGEIKLEHDHIKRYHSEEMKELTHLLTLIGIPGSQPHLNFESNENEGTTQLANHGNAVATNTTRETRKLRRRLTNYYANKPDALLKIMIALEFGIIDEEVRARA